MAPTLRLALATTALLLASPAHAGDEKPSRFSISLSAGIRPDMARLGNTIVQDGSVDVADTSLAAMAYSTKKALMSDRDNMTLQSNSKKTKSVYNVLSDSKEGGSLLGAELGGDIRYELDEVIDFPMYIKAGFYYTSKLSGGEQSRTLGDIAEQSETIAEISQIYGLDPADYSGGTMITEWSAAWVEVPISVGIKVPVKHHTFAYGSAGVSVFTGGFDIGLDVDEKYANVLNTHILDAEEGALVPVSVVDQSPEGGVQDTIKFRTTAVGLNYGLGVQAGIGRRVAVFMELNSSGAARTVFANEMSAKTKQLLTSASSATLAESDPQWFQDIAYPVVMGGATARLGVRAYLF